MISNLPQLFLIVLLSIFSFHTYAENDTPPPPHTININTANAEAISKALKGVGIKKAQAIVDYRESYGDFHHADELTAVKGIGKSTLAKNAHVIVLE